MLNRRFSVLFLSGLFLVTGQNLLAMGPTLDTVKLDVQLGQGRMVCEPLQKNFVKIALTGVSLADKKARAPVNVAIVLDRSGSMQGNKLKYAKEAAKTAIQRLGKDDILSVVAYDSVVQVLVPATKVSDSESIFAAIDNLEAGSNTALFGGVSKGAAELRKFLTLERVNRVILLSDGLANNGPSSPEELGQLGLSLSKDGISVTTLGLGLGYNEDLMTRLAQNSDGNHAFIEHPEDLARIFNLEFGDVMNVVALDVEVEVTFSNWKPTRALGRPARIKGGSVTARLNQLYGDQEKYLIIEGEIPSAGIKVADKPVVNVIVRYQKAGSAVRGELTGAAAIDLVENVKEASASEDRKVMVAVTKMLANESSKRATDLRDSGKVKEAKQELLKNQQFLKSNAEKYQAPSLEEFAQRSSQDAKMLESKDWNKTRKQMRKLQYEADQQQAW